MVWIGLGVLALVGFVYAQKVTYRKAQIQLRIQEAEYRIKNAEDSIEQLSDEQEKREIHEAHNLLTTLYYEYPHRDEKYLRWLVNRIAARLDTKTLVKFQEITLQKIREDEQQHRREQEIMKQPAQEKQEL